MEVMDVFMAQIVVMVFQVFISKFIKLYTLRTYSFFMLITSVKWFKKRKERDCYQLLRSCLEDLDNVAL